MDGIRRISHATATKKRKLHHNAEHQKATPEEKPPADDERLVSCVSCGFKNKKPNLFCAHCGYEIHKKYRGVFWRWFLLLLVLFFMSTNSTLFFILYIIAVFFFSRTVHRALSLSGEKHGFFMGFWALLPILGFFIPFFAARASLRPLDRWAFHGRSKKNETKALPDPTKKQQSSNKGVVFMLIIAFVIFGYLLMGTGEDIRNCIKRDSVGYSGQAAQPSCSDNDGTMKRTRLNGEEIGVCRAVSNAGSCIK